MNITNNVSTGYSNISQYGRYSKNNNDNKKRKVKSGRIRVHINFNAAGAMAKIANANKKSQVAAIERSLRAQLKDAIRYDSDVYTIKAIKKGNWKGRLQSKSTWKRGAHGES